MKVCVVVIAGDVIVLSDVHNLQVEVHNEDLEGPSLEEIKQEIGEYYPYVNYAEGALAEE